ncbi:hypothetical protein NEUTE1DRAFT_117388 [Neurospora tetrasperma FGSC 2508]|uniref:Uncharacterized protein n=1 Tax=Neurospora tetrasperma (strain FGSC 2508 / ATCC MYA-4615 / P0657) TaxID=510951 RepID=F8MQD9_NEUT8|nr:uncharacterized protein NEUTE1DRAFT_117388 [Neurospora tetrasperma FGSC 2508]EGO56569.1 hypothetical protein NEUTE1DRAFT_117388 [Neurospora tetrasperma FGSC 2508]EGZ70563.1 hypothetical protein NEUTE2DRAFT_145088 [Neurospora tetrasperma FGSC 2509]
MGYGENWKLPRPNLNHLDLSVKVQSMIDRISLLTGQGSGGISLYAGCHVISRMNEG